MSTKLKFSSADELKQAIKNVNYHPNKLRRFLRKAYWALFIYYLKPNHIVSVLTRTGLLNYESKDRVVGRILEVQRHFDFSQIESTEKHLKKIGILNKTPEGTVIDVGGFLGMSSISFMHENIFSKAIAFEPNPASYNLLKQNVSNNFLDDRISHYNMALSDTNSTLDFELSATNHGDHRIHNPDGDLGAFGEANRKIIPVTATKFDDFIAKEKNINTNDIKLIWMDTQGHEGHFLRGAKEFLLSHPHVPTLTEFWPYAILRSGISKSDFVEAVQSVYTHLFRETEDGFVEYNMDDLGSIFDEHMSPHEWWTILLINKTEGVNL